MNFLDTDVQFRSQLFVCGFWIGYSIGLYLMPNFHPVSMKMPLPPKKKYWTVDTHSFVLDLQDELLQSLQNCVATILSPEEFILPILDAIVEPLLKTVETSTQSLDTKDAAVFFVNNLNTIKVSYIALISRSFIRLLCWNLYDHSLFTKLICFVIIFIKS